VRIKTPLEAPAMAGFFFAEEFSPPAPDDLIQKKMDAAGTRVALERAHVVLAGLPDFRPKTQEAAMRSLADELGLKAGQLFGALRMATTAQRVSPPLFETTEILGREKTLARIKAAANSL
jgi:glutamyl-tRNA synthetase